LSIKKTIHSPQCEFKARILSFDPHQPTGMIDILEEHSKNCKYIPGNNTQDSKNLSQQTQNYKEMKEYIRCKLEEESWLSPENIQQMMKKDSNITIEKHLNISQITEIIKEWRRETIAQKNFI